MEGNVMSDDGAGTTHRLDGVETRTHREDDERRDKTRESKREFVAPFRTFAVAMLIVMQQDSTDCVADAVHDTNHHDAQVEGLRRTQPHLTSRVHVSGFG